MRRQLVVGNWKMNGSGVSNRALLQQLLSEWQGAHACEVAVCPPSVYLTQAADVLAGSTIGLGAQNACAQDAGAYTGEVSAPMLADVGCRYVVLGHSERRQLFHESDTQIADKFVAVQRANLVPILCVGESLEECDNQQTLSVVARQLDAVLERAGREAFTRAVIAYEPVWAIGTGRTATPEQAQDVHAFIRQHLGAVGAGVQILYGGSVKPDNAQELFAKPDIDGGLIGGASLDAEAFLAICRAADVTAAA